MNTELFIDIETIPEGEYPKIPMPPRPILQDVKVGNRKGALAENYRKERLPELIAGWKDYTEKAAIKIDEVYRKQALNSLTNRIVCIGYAWDDEKVKIFTGKEEKILKDLADMIDALGDKKMAIDIIGHNIIDFDLPNIYHKAIKYNISSLTRFLQGFNDHQGKAHLKDTMKIWSYMSYKVYTSQNAIAEFLGVPYSKDMDGSKVYDYWVDGKQKEIYEYCKKDIETVRGNYRKINI